MKPYGLFQIQTSQRRETRGGSRRAETKTVVTHTAARLVGACVSIARGDPPPPPPTPQNQSTVPQTTQSRPRAAGQVRPQQFGPLIKCFYCGPHGLF